METRMSYEDEYKEWENSPEKYLEKKASNILWNKKLSSIIKKEN